MHGITDRTSPSSRLRVPGRDWIPGSEISVTWDFLVIDFTNSNARSESKQTMNPTETTEILGKMGRNLLPFQRIEVVLKGLVEMGSFVVSSQSPTPAPIR